MHHALLRSFERHQQNLTTLLEAIRSGKLDPVKLRTTHQTLDTMGDIFDAKTADEEERTGDG
jgi:threonine dehydrogenase-like Zn-dependent dehydrogenase